MAGDWQTTSETLLYEDDVVKKAETDDVKPGGLNVGVRKRNFEGQEEEDEAGETVVRRGWGSTTRSYPGQGGDEDDLDTLLKSTKRVIREGEGLQTFESERLSRPMQVETHTTAKETQPGYDSPRIKKEAPTDSGGVSSTISSEVLVEAPPVTLKREEISPKIEIVFKKRKAKQIRQR